MKVFLSLFQSKSDETTKSIWDKFDYNYFLDADKLLKKILGMEIKSHRIPWNLSPWLERLKYREAMKPKNLHITFS